MSDASKPKNPLGPTGLIAASRIRELRDARGWGFKELSDRLTAAGRPIPPLGLRRIESEDRRIDVDDLTALAVVLGVNPSAILLPLRPPGEVEISGVVGPVDLKDAWDWADGKKPIDRDDDGVAGVYFADNARPPDRRKISWGSRAGRARIGRQYEGLDGHEVVWNAAGDDVIEIRGPGGVILGGPRKIDQGGDDGS